MTARVYRDDRGVVYVAPHRTAPASFARPTTCGTCHRTWDDGVITGVTPTPAARCPFESLHAVTEEEHVVQGDYGYGHGWEDLTASNDRREALAELRTYRESEPGVPHRIVRRRVPRAG